MKNWIWIWKWIDVDFFPPSIDYFLIPSFKKINNLRKINTLIHSFKRVRSIWNPGEFHGWGVKRHYFEGWYYKLVSADERYAFAFIPGIAFSEEGKGHAFIQAMDGKACRSQYHQFDTETFVPTPGKFELLLGDNYFSETAIRLNLPMIKGQVALDKNIPWPNVCGSPGIMGWYSYIPFMECNSGVISLDCNLSGTLTIDNQLVDFSDGKGYVEKGWGKSFPRAMIWVQSNHFEGLENTSLIVSVAHVPWMGSYFIGFAGGFLFEGKLFKFATYTGATQHLELQEDTLNLTLKDRKHELRIHVLKGAGAIIQSPRQGEMTGKNSNSLKSELTVEFLENGQRIYEGTGRNAGLEMLGSVEHLMFKQNGTSGK